MKNLLSAIAGFVMLATLAYPSLAAADEIDTWIAGNVQRRIVGYQSVCSGNSCSMQPVYSHVVVRRPQAASPAAPAPQVQFASATRNVDPEGWRETFRNLGIATDSEPIVISTSAPVVTSSTCNCAVTGLCSCDPATCRCASCATGRKNVLTASAAQAYSTAVSGMPGAVSERIINTPTGHVHVFADQFGNIATSHSGGRQQRRVARQERWRGRNGVQ